MRKIELARLRPLKFMFLLPLALFVSGCGKEAAKQKTAEFAVYSSYREIPGVTGEEIEAIERVKSARDGFTYGSNYSTEAFLYDDGTAGGFTALFCLWLSEVFGIQFKMVIAEWDDLVAGLASNAIDFSGELTATEERREIYYMTGAIAERSIKMMRIMKAEPFSVLRKSRPIRYAFLEGTTTYDDVLPHLNGENEILFFGDYDSVYQALKNLDADAFFDEDPSQAAFDIYGDVSAEDFFPLIYSPVSLTTQNPELSPFISVVQKAMGSGLKYHLSKLYSQGYRDYLQNRLNVQLTAEEKDFIRRHNTPETAVRIAAEYDKYPASFYNTHDREWQGAAFDLLREIELYTGLSFTVVNKPHTEFAGLLEMVEDGRASMVTELIRLPEREGRFIWTDAPYMQDFFALLSAVEYDSININEVFYLRIGLIADSAYRRMFKQWFPNHTNTVEYRSNLDALNGLANGEVDLVMATCNQLLSIVNFLERPGFKVNLVFNHPSDSFFGLNINESVLASIISKGQRIIDTEDIFIRWERKVFDYRGKMAKAQRPWLIGASVLLFFVLFLVVIILQRHRREGRRLEHLVKDRTRELENATDTALEASRTKSEFLANMSHEIRTPINAVTGMTAIARSSSDLNRIYDCLDKISAASKQLLGLINDILDMSKIEARKFDLASEAFILETMVRNVASIIGVRTAEKKQRFTVDLRPGLPFAVTGDEMRLSQILINLLSNAVKFTPEGGEICLTIQRLGSPGGMEELEASVKDTGIGITEEQKGRLFNAFVQAESGTSKRFGGTGLGLAISQSLAGLMGGGITVESTPGEGSCFTLRVLLKPGSCDLKKDSDAAKTPAEYDFKGRSLLLVEDVPINREIVIALLEDTGVSIDCAENGLIAVEKFTAAPGKYGLIFMDVQMPVLDGYSATRAIRAMNVPQARTVPIIAMTANAFAEDVEKCMNAGMNGHIAKPIEVEEMLDTAGKYLTGEGV
ncbi:MAG: ATP-binding protein [Treponema sp.]|nr:ATP-binding protein [Treponema sp.]